MVYIYTWSVISYALRDEWPRSARILMLLYKRAEAWSGVSRCGAGEWFGAGRHRSLVTHQG